MGTLGTESTLYIQHVVRINYRGFQQSLENRYPTAPSEYQISVDFMSRISKSPAG
jgi:hypothetical protein